MNGASAEFVTLAQLLGDEDPMTGTYSDGPITYYADLTQGSDEWLAARCGLLTASEMGLALTPTLKLAANDKLRQHVFEIAAQRINQYVEPRYVNDDMLRGHDDEIDAFAIYSREVAPIMPMGFITNSRHGFTLGYSPDGLIGEDGLWECKSRRQKFQVQTVVRHLPEQTIPTEFLLQVQTGLLVAEREWCDLTSFSGGMPMITIRAYPDDEVSAAILEAAEAFEDQVQTIIRQYGDAIASSARPVIETERKEYTDIIA